MTGVDPSAGLDGRSGGPPCSTFAAF